MMRAGTVLKRAALAFALLMGSSYAQQPARTTVSDIVYRADGSPASGTVLISWPAFTTADSKPVAAGTLSVSLGTGGTFSIQLVPNAGANPDGTFYKVVLKLDDGTSETETWVIPSSGTAVTIAAVRATVVPSSVALQVASRQYVDNAVAAKAADAGVVHIAGQETISGSKLFSVAPGVPAPQQATDAANKAYVDQSVSTVGAGSFVAKTGDIMTGQLTLPGDPTAPGQAARKQYVDTQLAAKADKVSGVVPLTELGNGTADGTKCLKGDQTWGACGTSSNAVQIQGKAVDGTAPSVAGQGYAWNPTANSGLGAWVVQAKTVIDLRDYGVVCNGVTDDAPAIQAVLNTISYLGSYHIKFPANKFVGGANALTSACLIGSQLTVKGWNVVLEGTGSKLVCVSTCFYINDPSVGPENITIEGFEIYPGGTTGTQAAVLDNGQNTRIVNLSAGNGINNTNRFGYFVENLNDQSQVIDGLNMRGNGAFVRCDATFCGAALYAPGPFNLNPAITTIRSSDLGMQCGGNGIDWHSGNLLNLGSGNIIQGYSEFAIRYDRNNGFANRLVLRDVYREAGSCTNPMGSVGQADIIVQGSVTVEESGGATGGNVPRFANSGSNHHMFYVVARNSTGGLSNPLPFGFAESDNLATFHVQFPRIPNAASYDILVSRQTLSTDASTPWGLNGNWLASTVLDTTCAPNPICDAVYDPSAALGVYAVPSLYSAVFLPVLNYWPAPVVLSASAGSSGTGTFNSTSMARPVVNVGPNIAFAAMSAGKKENGADVFPVIGNMPYNTLGYTGGIVQRGFMFLGTTEPWLAADQGRKGRLNFGGYTWSGGLQTDLITCRDSALLKTMAHESLRPLADAADCALGVVGPDIGYLRARTGWRFYFNALPVGPSDTNGIDLNSGGINLPAGAGVKFSIGGNNIVPLANKGDLLGFNGTAPAAFSVGGNGQCLVADSTQATGLNWGACGTGGGGGSAPGGVTTDVQFNDSGVFGGVVGFTFNKQTGDLTVPGIINASGINTTGTGAWSVEGAFGAPTAPTAGHSKVAFGATGQLTMAANGASTFTDVSLVGHTHGAADIASGTMAVARLPLMVASGASHAAGIVPDAGATAGTTKYLREDGTWNSPPGSGSGAPGGSTTQVQFNDAGAFGASPSFTFDKTTGNLSLGGTVTAASFATSGAGPWSVEGSFGTLTAPAASHSKIGFGTSGQLTVAQNGASSFTDVSLVGHMHAATDIVSGTMAVARLPVMAASGSSHAGGIVPDPGATAGTAKYLREDGTWVQPGFSGLSGSLGSGQDYSTAVTAGTYPKVTVNAQGRVTAGAALVAADVPNVAESQVTSLSTDLPKGIQTTKGDVIGFGSAPARLGVGADGQVLMADSTQTLGIRWAQGPGAVINTIAVGYVFLPGITIPQNSVTATQVTPTVNQLRVMQVVIPYTITVGKVVANITTVSSGQNLFVGVYDSTGNTKLVEAALSCTSLNGVSTSLSTAVTLTPGVYLYAYSASDTTCQASGATLSGGWFNMLDKNTTRTATAANSVSGGVMPSTLGTLTFSSGFTPITSMLER